MSTNEPSHIDWIEEAQREFERFAAGNAAPSTLPRGEQGIAPEMVEALGDALPGHDIGEPIGRGGQGVVLRATHRASGREVAVKVLSEGALRHPRTQARFEREVQVLGRLKHPNIVTVLDSGSAGGHYYYIMDFVPGAPLGEYVREAQLGHRPVLELFVTICDAVNAAHLRGIIHRDLKPANIRVDPEGRPHVLDFGLAKMDELDSSTDASAAWTQTGEFVGSLPYAAPEQLRERANQVDLRTDVYALGLMLYESLTGQSAYPVDGSIHAVIEHVLHTEPQPPSRIDARIPDEVDAIVLKCLRKDPEFRYQTAGNLCRELRRYLAGEAIEAKRDSNWYMLRKTLRRHRVSALVTGLLAVLVITVTIGLAVLYQQESRSRAIASAAAEDAKRRARLALAMSDFVYDDLLPQAWTELRAGGGDAVAVVNAAAERIEARAAGDRLVESAIHESLGNIYMDLGNWESALAHAENALAIWRAELGLDAPEALSTMNLIGRLQRRVGRYDDAERTFAGMLERARRVLGSDHELTMKGASNMAVVLSELGRHREAKAFNQAVLESRQRSLGRKHPDTLTSMNNAAFYNSVLGDQEEAAERYMEVYEIRRESLGPEHPDTLVAMNNVAHAWSVLGRWDDAQRLTAECLAMKRRVHGPNHQQTVHAMSLLGDLYRLQGQLALAEPLLLEALEAQRGLTGERHARFAGCLGDLADLYRDQNRWEEAENEYRRAREILLQIVGPDHTLTYGATAALGDLYLRRNLFDKAEPLLLDAYNGLAGRFGREHDRSRKVATNLAKLYAATGQVEKAAQWHAFADDNKSN